MSLTHSSVTMRVRSLMIVLWGLWLLLVGIHFVFCLDFQPASTYQPTWAETLIERFEIVGEGNIPTLFSALLFLMIALETFVIGIVSERQGDKEAVYWKALGWIFILLMIDEVGCFHEMLFLHMKMARTVGGILYYQWLGPALFFVFVLSLIYLKFFLSLPRKVQYLFLLAGGLFLGGTIGLEMIEGVLATQGTHEAWALSSRLSAIEEAMEMAGQIVFIYALFIQIFIKEPQCVITIQNGKKN